MTTLELTSNPADARQIDRLARWTRVLCVLFFFSGFPALIYQLTWQRALFRIFGVNIESVTIVVTAFMLGLGLGSLAGGWLSKRRGIPLLPLLGGIELMTGTFGLLSLKIFDRVSEFTAGLPLPATAAVSLALVIVPTLLMGATLPVLVGHLIRRSGHVGSALGLLYYVNTLGAGAACLACAAFLFPFVGMQGAVYVAVAVNAAVAAGAFAAYWRDRRDPATAITDVSAASVPRRPMLGLAPVLALASAGGFVSLSYEIFFFRTVSYATGSSATAFALTLGAFLIGLASGSRQAGRNCAALPPERAIRRAVTTLMSASVLGLLFLPLLDHLVWLGSGIVAVAFLLVYLVARLWGSLLPYLAEFGVAADDKAGMRTALLYLANILGSAAGSIVTGFVLTNRLSLVAIAAALVVASFVCVVILAGTLPLPRSEKLLHTCLAAGLAVLALAAIPRWSANVLADLPWEGSPQCPLPRRHRGQQERHHHRGGGRHRIRQRHDDGRFNTDLKHDTNGIVRPYALSLFHPAPRDVLMIGLSSGSWAQVIAEQSGSRLAHRCRDQSRLCAVDRQDAGSRLAA